MREIANINRPATSADMDLYHSLTREQQSAVYMVVAGVADAADRGIAQQITADWDALERAAAWDLAAAEHAALHDY